MLKIVKILEQFKNSRRLKKFLRNIRAKRKIMHSYQKMQTHFFVGSFFAEH